MSESRDTPPLRGSADAARHRAIFNSAVDFAIITSTVDGRVTDWNTGAEAIFGWTAAEMQGQPVDRIFTPEDRASGLPAQEMQAALQAGRASDERWHMKQTGERFWASGEMMPLRDDAGTLIGFVKILRDRTAQRVAAEAQRAETELLRSVMAASGDCIKMLDLDGNLLFMSEGGQRVMEVDDYAPLLGCPWPNFWRGQGNKDALDALAAARAGRTGRFRGMADTLRGNPRYWDVLVTPIPGPDGRPERLLSISRDMTGLQAAEAAQRESDALYRQSAEAGRTGSWEMQLDTGLCILSPTMAALLGLPAAALTATPDRWRQAIIPQDRLKFAEALNRAALGAPFECEFTVAFGNGVERGLASRGQLVRDATGRPVAIQGLSVDVTERRRTQAALRHSEAYVRLLLNSTAEGFYAVDREGRTTLCNPMFLRMMGYSHETEVLGRKLHAMIHHTHPDGTPYNEAVCPIYVCAATGRAAHITGETFFRADGTAVPVEYWAHPIIRDGALEGAVVTFLDVTERVAAEAALRESEARFRHMADSAPALICMTDQTGSFIFANMHFEHLFGRPTTDFLQGAWYDVVLDSDVAAFRQVLHAALAARQVFRTELRVRDRSGAIRWLRGEGVPRQDDFGGYLGFTCCMLDVTEARLAADTLERRVQQRTAELSATLEQLHAEIRERERAEAQLRQSQKMEAVGQLTGGLAHDFNNLLTGITGSLSLLRTRVAQGRLDTLDRYFDAAQNSSDRAAALTHRLLAFSRQQTLAPVVTDANALARGMEEMVRRTAGPAIQVETNYGAALWTTLCDPHQLENALLNLCINARDAMPEGGRLVIETANAWLDDTTATARDLAAGAYVEIRVSDTGVGMPPEVVARAFEPFFTTKPIGQGTGLGLSMIYGFARQSGGQVRIHSAVGVGTTMRVYLPRHEGVPEAAPADPPRQDAMQAAEGECVLVIDDEPTVRMLVVEVLQELGYRAIEAKDGPSAMVVLRTNARIDLLITDVGLPGGMNGRQVADAGRALRPGLKVLFMTGFAESAVMGKGALETGLHVLTKPFAMDALAQRIRTIIEGPPAGSPPAPQPEF